MGTRKSDRIPVIDLFAGPGGLGEGFGGVQSPLADIVLSVEAERWAHDTLTLRKYRQLGGRIPRAIAKMVSETRYPQAEKLMAGNSVVAAEAISRALQLRIGSDSHDELLARVDKAIGGRGNEWLLIGGPPCQAYSLVGRARNKGVRDYIPEDDHRHFLYRNYLRLIADRQPAAFIMENVKGILSSTVNGNRIFHKILEDLVDPRHAFYGLRRGPKYRLHCVTKYGREFDEGDPRRFIIKSERHNIPQARHRVILVGVRDDLGEPGILREQDDGPTICNTIDDLPAIRSQLSKAGLPNGGSEWAAAIESAVMHSSRRAPKAIGAALKSNLKSLRKSPPPAVDTAAMRVDDKFVWNHGSRGHIVADLARYFYAATFAEVEGRSPSIREFPEALWPNHANVHNGSDNIVFSDRFRVQLSGSPATTVTSHISKDGHYYIHYDSKQCRSLSVREAARIQTFPDDYIFCGPRTAQYVQVGNAVPPKLARQIAKAVMECLR